MPIAGIASLSTGPVPWKDIHATAFVYEPGCWTTCGGGFCCSNNHPDFQFQLLPTHGTTILYIGDEYDWLASHGRVHRHVDPSHQVYTIDFDFGGPRNIRLVQTPCRYLGLCGPHIDKPLLCRTYPFLPVLDIEGRLETVYPASIFEATLQIIGDATPCSVWGRKRESYLQQMRQHPGNLALMRHPLLVFYLQAARHFLDLYREKLLSDEKLQGLRGPTFWRTWELRYLGGFLMDASRLRQLLLESYKNLEASYGRFLESSGGSA